MNSGITLVDVRNKAFQAIQKLESGDMKVETAHEIRGFLDTIIDTARVQVSYINALPVHVKNSMTVDEAKAIAGTLLDRDAELDLSLSEIKQNQSKPIALCQ